MGTEDEDAIDPEYTIPDGVTRRKIEEAYDGRRPSIPADEAFAQLRRHHADRMRARNARRPSR
jgi:hypothetical protein